MVPSLSSTSSNTPSNSKDTILLPSGSTSLITPLSTVGSQPNTTVAPSLRFLPGLTIHSQSVAVILLRSRISHAPVCPSLCPMSRAGMTFVSLITRQSPFLKKSPISKKCLCSMCPSFLSSTRSLEDDLSSSGSCAISLSGRS